MAKKKPGRRKQPKKGVNGPGVVPRGIKHVKKSDMKREARKHVALVARLSRAEYDKRKRG